MDRRLVLACAFTLVACTESTTAPPTPDPVERAVASVTVTSPIGAIVGVGGDAQLTAAALDASSQPISTSFTWTTGDGAIASITATGLLTGTGPGATTVTATADGVSGTLSVVVADADLTAIASLLDDPLADELMGQLGATTESALRALWAECASARTDGNLAALQACVVDARDELAADTDEARGPLRTLLSLFLDWIDNYLRLS